MEITKHNLFPILRSFTKNDFKEFKKYLNSEYFGRKPSLLKLLDILQKFHPMYNHIRLNKIDVWKKLYYEKPYIDSTLRNMFSDLHKSVLHFIMIRNFENSEYEKYNFLFNELSIRGLYDDFFSLIEGIKIETEELVDSYYFYNKHVIETNKFNFSHLSVKLQKEKNLEAESNYMNSSINALIYYFLTEFFAIYLNLLFFQNSFNTDNFKKNLNQILEIVNFDNVKALLHEEKHFFVVELYELLIKAFNNTNKTSYYLNYKSYLNGIITKLSSDEKCFHYFQLITYNVLGTLFQFTSFDYEGELKNLYTEILESRYYQDKNTKYLPAELYRNILHHFTRMKDYEWVINFVNKYSFMVFPNDRENIFYYGNAYLNFNMGDYKRALEFINKIDLTFFVYKVDVKNLMLMIYYELGDTEGTLSLITSYREYIRKNKLIHPERKKRYTNFSKFLEKLVLCRAGTLKSDIGYIQHKLNTTRDTAFKSWLEQKISYLSQGVKIAG